MRIATYVAILIALTTITACASETVPNAYEITDPTPATDQPAGEPATPSPEPTKPLPPRPSADDLTSVTKPAVLVDPSQPAYPAPVEPGPPPPEALQAMVDEIKLDLAAYLQIPASNVSYVDYEGRDWPDSSLGCPAPGMMYLQVITPGYLVHVAASGAQYDYHTSASGGFLLCVKGQPASPQSYP